VIFYPAELDRLDRVARACGLHAGPDKGRSPGLPSAEDALRARVARRAMAIGLALLEDDPSIFEAEL
ncbi:MAG: hypothetical protein K8H88_16530, partial [Sandaracinaceae bacterium]|nr:hypothetical protein [Sandaracinaceae bacterium]